MQVLPIPRITILSPTLSSYHPSGEGTGGGRGGAQAGAAGSAAGRGRRPPCQEHGRVRGGGACTSTVVVVDDFSLCAMHRTGWLINQPTPINPTHTLATATATATATTTTRKSCTTRRPWGSRRWPAKYGRSSTSTVRAPRALARARHDTSPKRHHHHPPHPHQTTHPFTHKNTPKQTDAREVAAYLVPHVPHLLCVVHPSPSAATGEGERPDHHAAAPFRTLPSLGALLELLPPPPPAGVGVEGGVGGGGRT